MRRVVHREIFELPEWSTLRLHGRELSGSDRNLVASVSEETKSKFVLEELRDELRLTSRSWVGTVQFNEFEVRIVPKLAGDYLSLANLIDFVHGLDSLERIRALRTFEGAGASLFDLIALLLVETCEAVTRTGVLSDYCEVENPLPVLRGRLLVTQQVLRHFKKVDRLECRYDEYVTDVIENQILLAALSACASRVTHPALVNRVRRLKSIFSEVCSLKDFDLRLVRSNLAYNRMNEHYRVAHEIAWLVLTGLGIEDLFDAGPQNCFAFLLDMNSLFQGFVTRYLTKTLAKAGCKVIPQKRDQTVLWNADTGASYSSIIPDILIVKQGLPGIYLSVDAKYKLYDERTIANSDIYQTMIYAFAYGGRHKLPTSLILYPASDSSNRHLRLHVCQSGSKVSAQLRALPVNIPAALEEVRERRDGPLRNAMLEIIGEVFGNGA
jgi:5-methylcytosine-specific restriction enzyme subunit McrC